MSISARKELARKIQKERVLLQDDERKLQELQTQCHKREAFIRGLEEALKLLPQDHASGEADLRPGSAMALARQVILNAGRPLHIGELLEAMGKDDSKANRASIASSLRGYAKKGQVFTIPHPATFGLRELEAVGKVEERAPREWDEYDPFAELP